MADHPTPDDEPEAKSRSNIIGAVVVLVLVLAVGWLAHALYKNLQLQKCELEGRHDCTDMPQPEQQ
jgi:hypothetical protein